MLRIVHTDSLERTFIPVLRISAARQPGQPLLGVGDLRQKCDLLEEGIRALSKDYRRMQVMLTKFVEILDEMNPRPTLLPYDARKGK